MFIFAIIEFKKKGKQTIRLHWDETTILNKMKDEMPVNTHPAVEKAWNKIIGKFKQESVKLK